MASEDADLRDQIAVARDFALSEARRKFAEADDAPSVPVKLADSQMASGYRSIARVLNVLLGETPEWGDPTPPRPVD
ncbi:MAG: hypothetical protein JWO98_2230 [Frankiales bacterium]|nr:hypothetical protein [Frankiales bacterium]